MGSVSHSSPPSDSPSKIAASTEIDTLPRDWLHSMLDGERERRSFKTVIRSFVKSQLGPDPTAAKLCCRFWRSSLPIVDWLPRYSLKQDLIGDLIAGFTVAILHIPQGLAYAILAGVPPIHGLYVSTICPIVYALLGSSRHLSVGTFAVGSIMTANTISKVLHGDVDTEQNGPTPIEIAISLCFFTGLAQVLMSLVRLGSGISLILSGQLISAFCAGSAIQIATSQLGDLVGVKYPKRGNMFGKTVLQWGDLFAALPSCNPASLLIGCVTVALLLLTKMLIDPRTRPHIKIPIPIDFIVVIGGTLLSWLCGFNSRFGVEVIGEIPTGLPPPVVPRLDLFDDIIFDSILFAIVAFAFSLSPAILYAKKCSYEISANQEMLAFGLTNLASSFFACFPCASALSRTAVQENSGGKTQLASLVTAAILFVVLLVIGPLFYHLPRCVLAAVIIVALRPMFNNILDVWTTGRVSGPEAVSWMVTFLGVIVLGVDWGLITGILFSLLLPLIQILTPLTARLVKVANMSDVYLDERYSLSMTAVAPSGLTSQPKFCILKFYAPLVFLNRQTFLDEVKQVAKSMADETILVVDLTSVPFVDYDGVGALAELLESHAKLRRLRLVSSNPQVVTMLDSILAVRDLSATVPLDGALFPSMEAAMNGTVDGHSRKSDTRL